MSVFISVGYWVKYLKSFNVNIIIIILKRRKLSFRVVKEFVRGFLVKDWGRRDVNLRLIVKFKFLII